jgi:hypothetical protein
MRAPTLHLHRLFDPTGQRALNAEFIAIGAPTEKRSGNAPALLLLLPACWRGERCAACSAGFKFSVQFAGKALAGTRLVSSTRST